MKILPVDKQILSMLRPVANIQLAWHQCTANYWFMFHFKNAHTLMFTLEDDTYKLRGGDFWMCDDMHTTLIEQHLIVDTKGKPRGYYNYLEGFITDIVVEDTHIPLRKWASEYITLYNAKHKTQYLTFYELRMIEQLFKETT